jgi:AraC-like DNA-binding protein
MNFCDFVNRYRVNEFKRLAVLPDSEKFNLLGLALDSGFNSKATFNSSFRKATGMTPSAWRISANRV